jgi:putative endopeptidase
MRYFTSSLTSALLTGCLAVNTAWSQAGPGQSSGKPFFEPFGLDLSALDKRTRPQDDFYQYVNGAWIARTTIPADMEQVEVTGNQIQDRVDTRIRALLEAAAIASQGPVVTAEQKAGVMYAAFMDESRIERLGAAPIEPELAAVRASAARAALARIMG